jgi:predicted Zn-dependent protease
MSARAPVSGIVLPQGVELAYARVRAKLIGYFRPEVALAQFSADAAHPAARYGYAVALYRRARIDDAAAVMQTLLAEAPNDPFFNEMLGQILMDGGRMADARQYYERANELLPGEPLILLRLAQIRLEEGGDIALAVEELSRVVAEREGRMPFAWRLLARAHGLQGDLGMAALALAEEALAKGEPEEALAQARRAEQSLPFGSPGWLRLQDLAGRG